MIDLKLQRAGKYKPPTTNLNLFYFYLIVFMPLPFSFFHYFFLLVLSFKFPHLPLFISLYASVIFFLSFFFLLLLLFFLSNSHPSPTQNPHTSFVFLMVLWVYKCADYPCLCFYSDAWALGRNGDENGSHLHQLCYNSVQPVLRSLTVRALSTKLPVWWHGHRLLQQQTVCCATHTAAVLCLGCQFQLQ